MHAGLSNGLRRLGALSQRANHVAEFNMTSTVRLRMLRLWGLIIPLLLALPHYTGTAKLKHKTFPFYDTLTSFIRWYYWILMSNAIIK
jgi:hypothetical protein